MKSDIQTLYVGSNLKMYKNVGETLDFFSQIDVAHA